MSSIKHIVRDNIEIIYGSGVIPTLYVSGVRPILLYGFGVIPTQLYGLGTTSVLLHGLNSSLEDHRLES